MSDAGSAPALAITGLRTSYGTREVLRGLDLAIAPGEIFGLLGPNGAGKTTVIRTICGRVTIQAGAIAIAGRSNLDRRALRGVGLVPQEIALYPHLTARENLDVFGQLSGLTRPQAKAAIVWAAGAADIATRLDQRIDTLSGGWKRRVNIAAAILHRPALLILDEPTVGVDVDARNTLHEVILELSRSGMGVLLATHDLEQAETLCTTVGFLRDGVIAPQGAPRALIEAAFDGQKQIIIELRHALSQPQGDAMARAGFAAANAGLTWAMVGGADNSSMARIATRLEEHGVPIREVRLREPGLDTLFTHLSRTATPTQDAAA